VTDVDLMRAFADLARLRADRPDRAAYLASLVRNALAPFEARASGIGIIDDHGLLEITTMHGFEVGTLRRGPRFPLVGTLPLTDCVLRGSVISGTYVEMIEQYPALAEYAPHGAHALYLPLRYREVVIGGMSIGMDQPAALDRNAPFWSAVADVTTMVVTANGHRAARS
jgi:hypothetical protein